jgi:hypothetical protein
MIIRLQIVTERWNPISAAIRYTTRSWASHAEFFVNDGYLQYTLGARSLGGVKIRPASRDHYSRVEQFTANGIEQAYAWAYEQIGKPYDFSAITGIALDRNYHDENRWFCSELVAVAFEQVGAPLLSTRPSNMTWRITPRDLLLSRKLYYLADHEPTA